MLNKFLLLLINLLAASALAQEQPKQEREPVGFDSSVSGFAYYRAFSDHDWHNDDAKLAANFFLGYKAVSASAQVAKSLDKSEEVLKRLFVTGDVFITHKAHFHVDYGRIPVFTSFYNNATDSPSAAGMALLPMAGYSHRMNNGMFTLLDGERIRFDTVVGNSELVQFQYTQGEVFIESQDKIQREGFNTTPRSDIKIATDGETSRAIAIKYENDFLIWFWSRNEYLGKTEVVSPNPVSQAIAANYANFEYVLEKFGARYFNEYFFIQGEYLVGTTSVHNTANKMVVNTTSYDHHGIFGVNISDCSRVYIGRSVGHSGGRTKAEDNWIGYTHDMGDWVISLDYHEGRGHAWAKYTHDYSKPMEWKSLVSSIAYRFQ